jgi:hypothetical protein
MSRLGGRAVLAKHVHELHIAAGFVIPRIEHAHGGQERNPCGAFSIESPQQQNRLVGNGFKPPFGDGNTGVFEGRIFPVLARARPQLPYETWGALQIHVNKNFPVHLSITRLRGFLLFPGPGKTDALGELFLFELASDRIVRRVGEIRDTVHQAQSKQDRGVVADVDASVAFLDLVERHANDGSALRKNRGRNPPPPPRVPDIMPQLAERPDYRNRERWRFTSFFHITSIPVDINWFSVHKNGR